MVPSKKVDMKKEQEERLAKFKLYAIYIVLAILVAITVVVMAVKWSGLPEDDKTVDQLAKESLASQKAAEQNAKMQSQTQQLSQQQSSSQSSTQSVVVNGLGATGGFVVEWLDLIVLLVVLGAILGVFIKLGDAFK